jgi:hypothetical protein
MFCEMSWNKGFMHDVFHLLTRKKQLLENESSLFFCTLGVTQSINYLLSKDF